MAALNMCVSVFRNMSGINRNILYKCNAHRASVSWFSRSRSTDSNADTKKETNSESTPESTEAKPSEMELKLKAENENLTAKYNELDDKYKRALAERENVRNRLSKLADDAKLFAVQGFCKDLLTVADIIHTAVNSVKPEDLESYKGTHFGNLFEGLLMTEKELQQVFNRNGLAKINPKEGDQFDPNFHEALFVQPTPEGKKGGTVMIVTKLGYKLHERTIRPALVGVYKSGVNVM